MLFCISYYLSFHQGDDLYVLFSTSGVSIVGFSLDCTMEMEGNAFFSFPSNDLNSY